MKKKTLLLAITVLVPVCLVSARSLWKASNLFSSRSRVGVGDIIKVRFAYKNLVRYRSEMKSGTTQKASLGKPSLAVFSFLPAFDHNYSVDRNNNVEYSTEKEFQTMLAVTVTAVSGNIISFNGRHSILVNGQQETISISGRVRNNDIEDGNTVRSTDIADLAFSYEGPRIQRTNTLNPADLVYPTASTNATNAASQLPSISRNARRRLVLRYLNRIADILFRP